MAREKSSFWPRFSLVIKPDGQLGRPHSWVRKLDHPGVSDGQSAAGFGQRPVVTSDIYIGIKLYWNAGQGEAFPERGADGVPGVPDHRDRQEGRGQAEDDRSKGKELKVNS